MNQREHEAKGGVPPLAKPFFSLAVHGAVAAVLLRQITVVTEGQPAMARLIRAADLVTLLSIVAALVLALSGTDTRLGRLARSERVARWTWGLGVIFVGVLVVALVA